LNGAAIEQRKERRTRNKVHPQVVDAGWADRDKRDNQRAAVFRVIVPLLTALSKARLTVLI
jgi:hypothetical protein